MIGKTVAHYEITALLGRGGMGEVYRARDTKLDREVALKVLPAETADDAERAARFEREARTLASLQHQNIASVYGFEHEDDVTFLVMELVEGRDLAERIQEDGPLPVRDALEIAVQIAAGLETAHDQGIVHRDLKPANVKVAPDGTVKILDFGLARVFGAIDEGDPALSPTITAAMTQAGTILGTAAYMSPEQARGKPVDRRTDVWAFACVLYEMLTGKVAFAGETITDVLTAIVHVEPDLAALPADVDPVVVRLMRRCLNKDPRRRLRDIGDVRSELEDVLNGPPSGTGLHATPREAPRDSGGARRRSSVAIATLAVITVATSLWAITSGRDARPSPAPGNVVRASIVLPDGQRQPRLMSQPLAITADGSLLAYCARDAEGTVHLFLREMTTGTTRVIPGAEDSSMPFFSPDGRWVGFYSAGALRKAPVDGGAPVRLARMGNIFGATWGPDDTIVYAPAINAGLWTVDANGGEPVQLTEPDFETNGYAHVWPQFLPGGDRVLFQVWGTMGEARSTPQVLDLVTGEWTSARANHTSGDLYLPTRHLAYTDIRGSGNFFAMPFDLTNGTSFGQPVPLLPDVRYYDSQSAEPYFVVSHDGTVVYVSHDHGEADIVWVAADGTVTPIARTDRAVAGLSLSPDERRAFFHDEQGGLWVVDLERGSIDALLASEDFFNAASAWSPDGTRLAVSSNDAGSWDVYEFDLRTRGRPEPRLQAPYGQFAASWVGDTIVYTESHPVTGSDIGILASDGRTTKIEGGPANQFSPELSPDGRLLAFVSDESDRNQIYVRVMPDGERRSVSIGGGREPVWSGDGRLFFRHGYTFLAVDVDLTDDGSLRIGRPVEVFEHPLEAIHPIAANSFYDVTGDGRRILGVTARPTTHFELITNWFTDVNAKVAPGRD